jgi:hypothetical protein
MASALIVGGALANWGPDAPEDEFLELLAQGVPDVPVFRLVSRPGHPRAAAFDWQSVLGTGADLIAYETVLWAGYERFVKPRLQRHKERQSPFLFVAVRRPDGSFTQFQLGREYDSEKAFAQEFERQVSALRETSDGPTDAELIREFSQDEVWVLYARRNRGHS